MKLIDQNIEENGIQMSKKKIQSIKEEMIWTVIDGVVYDITNYVGMHPGGLKKILRGKGVDATIMFHKFHRGVQIDRTPLALLKLGEIPHLIPKVNLQNITQKKREKQDPGTFAGIEIEGVDSSSDEETNANNIWRQNTNDGSGSLKITLGKLI